MKGTTVYLAFNRISDAYVQESFIPEKSRHGDGICDGF